MNQRLGQQAIEEICDAMRGLTRAQAANVAQELAAFYGVTPQTIYNASRQVRPQRKRRVDAGNRKANLLEDPGLRFVGELVVNQDLMPTLAIEVAELNGFEIPVNPGTVRRYLRESGINRKANRRDSRAHRRWEAEFPGQIFQFDISGLKQRWIDIKTRKILKVSELEVSKNHANSDHSRLPIWAFHILDDYSRFRFVRYVACNKPNSTHVVTFLLEAFRVMGVPLMLYSDRDGIIIGKRGQRAAKLLNEYYAEAGGFELKPHKAGNPQASGKVERGHQAAEEFQKLIGVKYETPTLEDLNRFAEWHCARHAKTVHRDTGVQPRIRFADKKHPIRLAPDATLDAAFKADEFTKRVNADVTVTIEGEIYQLPRQDKYPFVMLAETGQKLTIIWPPEVDYFVAVAPDGAEYTITKVLARADAAGEYKALPETRARKTRKALKASAQERRKALQAEGKELLVMGLDTAPEVDSVSIFPPRLETADADALDRATHGLTAQLRGEAAAGPSRNKWQTLFWLQEQGIFATPPSEEDNRWLDQLFAEKTHLRESEVNEALQQRQAPRLTLVPKMKVA